MWLCADEMSEWIVCGLACPRIVEDREGDGLGGELCVRAHDQRVRNVCVQVMQPAEER